MSRQSRSWLLSCACFIVILSLPVASTAQYKEIDRVGDEFAHTLTDTHSDGKVITVADLRDPSGTANYQGHYFALFLTSAINSHRKGAPEVAEHNSFDDALIRAEISPATLTTLESLTRIAETIHVDVVVVGDFARDADNYSLHLSAIRTIDGVVLHSTKVRLRHTNFLDSLALPFPPFGFENSPRLTKGENKSIRGFDGKPPRCKTCPIPEYTSVAREAKIQGVSKFDAIISQDGKVVALRPTRIVGMGLDEIAWELIMKSWRLEPAADKNGNPVSVWVPIDVTFRLH